MWYFDLIVLTHTAASGLGVSLKINQDAGTSGIDCRMNGTGGAGFFHVENASNGTWCLRADTNGTSGSVAIFGSQEGLGDGIEGRITNAANAQIAGIFQTDGLGKGLQVKTTNASNTSASFEIIQSGTGPAAIISGGDVMIGTGTPSEKLEVEGSIKSSSPGSDGNFSFDNASAVETIKGDTNGVSFFNGGNLG